MLLWGSLLGGLGVVVPWYLVVFAPPGGSVEVGGVVHEHSFSAVNGLDLHKLSISNGWITLYVKNETLLRGVHFVILAAAISFGFWVVHRFSDWRQWENNPTLVKYILSGSLKLVSFGAILGFVTYMWSATRFVNYTDPLRQSIFTTLGGGSTGQYIAESVYAIPFLGLYMVIIGLSLSVLGFYSRDATPNQVQNHSKWIGRAKSVLGSLVTLVVFAAIMLGFADLIHLHL